MSVELLDEPRAARPKAVIDGEKRWTRHELYELCDEGWFADERVNLIDGRIIVMPLPGPEHNYSLETLVEYLESIVPAGYFVRSEKALGVDEHNDPGPDAAVIPGSRRDYLKDHPTKAIFTAEVANSTLKADLNVKPHLYASAGVREYWVLDLMHRRLIVHLDPLPDEDAPMNHRYAVIRTLGASESVAPHFASTSQVTVESLLPPVEP